MHVVSVQRCVDLGPRTLAAANPRGCLVISRRDTSQTQYVSVCFFRRLNSEKNFKTKRKQKILRLFDKKKVSVPKKQRSKKMMILILVALVVYWLVTTRKSGHVDLPSASPLDPDEVQLLVARVPVGLKNITIQGDPGCEYDVFVDNISIIDHPIAAGTAKLTRDRKPGQADDLIVVQKKNITLERTIAPSVVRFH